MEVDENTQTVIALVKSALMGLLAAVIILGICVPFATIQGAPPGRVGWTLITHFNGIRLIIMLLLASEAFTAGFICTFGTLREQINGKDDPRLIAAIRTKNGHRN